MCANSRRRSSSTTACAEPPGHRDEHAGGHRLDGHRRRRTPPRSAAAAPRRRTSPAAGCRCRSRCRPATGPASAASDATTISGAVTARARRCGRSRSASSRRLRRRSSAATARTLVDLLGGHAAPRRRSRRGTRHLQPAHPARARLAGAPLLGHRHQVRVGGLGRHQLAVAADRGDDPAVQQRHPVGERDRGRPVRDDQRRGPGSTSPAPGSTRSSVCTSSADSGSSRISTSGRARIGAGQRDPLPLPAGQRHALLADPGVEPPRQVVGEPACAAVSAASISSSDASGAPNVTFSRTLAENSVASSNAQRHRGAQRGQRDVPHVGAVEQHPAAGRVREPRHQLQQRRLARPGRPDQHQRLARRQAPGRRPAAPARPRRGRRTPRARSAAVPRSGGRRTAAGRTGSSAS